MFLSQAYSGLQGSPQSSVFGAKWLHLGAPKTLLSCMQVALHLQASGPLTSMPRHLIALFSSFVLRLARNILALDPPPKELAITPVWVETDDPVGGCAACSYHLHWTP